MRAGPPHGPHISAPDQEQGFRSISLGSKRPTNLVMLDSEHCWVLQCGARYGQAWPRSLRAYPFPRIGAVPMSEVTTADALAILTPI